MFRTVGLRTESWRLWKRFVIPTLWSSSILFLRVTKMMRFTWILSWNTLQRPCMCCREAMQSNERKDFFFFVVFDLICSFFFCRVRPKHLFFFLVIYTEKKKKNKTKQKRQSKQFLQSFARCTCISCSALWRIFTIWEFAIEISSRRICCLIQCLVVWNCVTLDLPRLNLFLCLFEKAVSEQNFTRSCFLESRMCRTFALVITEHQSWFLDRGITPVRLMCGRWAVWWLKCTLAR